MVVGRLHVVLLFAAQCFFFVGTEGQASCGRSANLVPFGTYSRNECGRVSECAGKGCCWKDGVGCMANARSFTVTSSGFRSFGLAQGVPPQPDPSSVQRFVRSMPPSTDPTLQRSLGRVPGTLQQNALQRSLSFGLLSGAFGGGSILDLFPKCPVHVKLCYRVPCGGFGSDRKPDDNPGECLKDPTCCFDYQLAFLKSIFGPNVMGGAPSCYYGATSQQWRYITSFFRPWSPWYTNFILDAFREVFNTKLFNLGGQVLCQFDFQVKNYPVGSKSELECNLVSGCWDASRPVGRQCTMANSLIKNIFGGFVSDQAIYPSLYTSDPSDTRCASNWFDYGPKAYRRMECDVVDEPSDFTQKLLRWCPYQDCCLNYAAFSASQLGQLALINSIGGGGNPITGGILPNLGGLPAIGGGSIFGNALGLGGGLSTLSNVNLLYLLSASQTGASLESIFCPYRNLFSFLIDLSETTEGCCDIPKCYHKKKYVGGTPTPTGPPTILPPIGFGRWGQWGQCNALCNQQGSRTRTCYLNNQPTSPSQCSGSSSEVCYGPPCPTQGFYYWSQWVSSSCDVTCGPGTLTRTRYCQSNSGQQVSSNFCPGLATQRVGCSAGQCPSISYSWGQWTASSCSRNCGGGTITYTRNCLNNFGQVVNSGFCPGGAGGATTTATCNTQPCQGSTYSWGPWRASSCDRTCGPGTITYTRRCRDSFGRLVANRLCRGRPRTSTSCNLGACQTAATYRWSTNYRPSGSCSRPCGPGIQTYVKYCQSVQTGATVPDYLCGPNRPTATGSCNLRNCFGFGG